MAEREVRFIWYKEVMTKRLCRVAAEKSGFMDAVELDEHMLMRTIEELRSYGITYLIPTNVSEETALGTQRQRQEQMDETSAFLRALALSPVPRVRDALVSVLLLHPEMVDSLVAAVGEAREQGNSELVERLTVGYLATLYMQRVWYPELVLAFGVAPGVPVVPGEVLWRERDLPAPWVGGGVAGLVALERYAREHLGWGAPTAADWRNQLVHLVREAWRRRIWNGDVTVPEAYQPLLPADGVSFGAHGGDSARLGSAGLDEEREVRMSMRQDVDQQGIERFLQELGRMVHTSGRIYLAGGAALVHGQVRGVGASTADIDLKLDVADENEVESAIRQLKTRLGINVELASPADFIPLPVAWERMSKFVGRYGSLDVFYFDYVTLALAKIDRASARDIVDVELLAQNGLIQQTELEAALNEILPQLGHGRYFNIDPQVFEQKVRVVIAQVWQTGP